MRKEWHDDGRTRRSKLDRYLLLTMKTEIQKTFTDISAALASGCHWSGSADSGSVVSNVSVLFAESRDERVIRGVQLSGDVLYVMPTESLDMVQLNVGDTVYVDLP